jgi:hypothetical protein
LIGSGECSPRSAGTDVVGYLTVKAILNRRFGLGGLAKLVALSIAELANDADGGAWPSVETIAARVERSRRPVQRALARLESAGELVRFVGGGGPGDSTLYVLVLGRTGAELERAVACARARRGDFRERDERAAVATPLAHEADEQSASAQAPQERRCERPKGVARSTRRASLPPPQPSSNQKGTRKEPEADTGEASEPAEPTIQTLTHIQAELTELGVSGRAVGPISATLAKLAKPKRDALLRDAERGDNPAGWLVTQVRRLGCRV